jgi:hypothetical protein
MSFESASDDFLTVQGEPASPDVSRLRYHLTNLYTLRPVPEDFLILVREIQLRRRSGSPSEAR